MTVFMVEKSGMQDIEGLRGDIKDGVLKIIMPTSWFHLESPYIVRSCKGQFTTSNHKSILINRM